MTELKTSLERIFSVSGLLSTYRDFEHRPQQGVMAAAIADALEQHSSLIIEAPTGVGKTLAYLLPAILYSLSGQRKAIVSTHTRNLQDQIVKKDIPIIKSLLSRDFPVVALKGRRNYLCTTRLRTAMASTRSLFSSEDVVELKRIHEWSLSTDDGDIESLEFTPSQEVWDMVCSEQGICSIAACGPNCFFQHIREQARSAAMVIMNHALFFKLMALQENDERFIFDDDFVVFDEAHTLESIAATGIGGRISCQNVMAAIRRLYNPQTKTGLLAKQGKNLKTVCGSTEKVADELFSHIRQTAIALDVRENDRGGRQGRAIRIRTRRFIENSLYQPLADLQGRVQKVEESIDSPSTKQELAAARRSLGEAQQLIENFLEQADPGLTYWIETSGAHDAQVALCSSPSHVGEILGPRLFKTGLSVIMTSATLAVNNSLDYFQNRIGAGGVRSLVLDSPFDYSRQMTLCLAQGMPEPDSEDYGKELPLWIMRSIDRTQGKALVLFTSGMLMRSVAAALEQKFQERQIALLVQGVHHARHRLLEEFKRNIHSVLFGLESFWMGIDVPGEALEHVIITRLPFAVPDHPLVEARLEEIAKRGGNAFLEYTLPEAVLKLRQGVGRLLRTSRDRGIITLLDSRVVHKSYGRVFLESLPRCRIELLTETGETEYTEAGDW